MAVDFLSDTVYKKKTNNAYLVRTTWDDSQYGGQSALVETLLEELAGTPYTERSEWVETMLNHCDILINDPKKLLAVAKMGVFNNHNLLKANIVRVEDMLPFLDDTELGYFTEPLLNYYLKKYELEKHILSGYSGGRYKDNINKTGMSYFLARTGNQETELGKELEETALYKSYQVGGNTKYPLAGTQGVIEFLREEPKGVKDGDYYVSTIPLHVWEMDPVKLSILKNRFKQANKIAPNIILRNGYLGVGTVWVVDMFIEQYWRIDPVMVSQHKEECEKVLFKMVKQTVKKLESGVITDKLISRRYWLVRTFMHLTTYGVGNYQPWIAQLAYYKQEEV